MVTKLSREDVKQLLAEAAESFPHDTCLTCECFLGYVIRLQVDSDQSSRDLIDAYQVERKNMHSCLGCNPCPPGDLYAEYIHKRQQPSLIALD